MDHAFISQIIKLIADGDSGKAISKVSTFLQGDDMIGLEKKIEGILICERYNHLKKNKSLLNLEQKELLRTKVLHDLLHFLSGFMGPSSTDIPAVA